jgi:hypothetical protein
MIPQDFPPCYYSSMRNLAVLVIHLIATLALWLANCHFAYDSPEFQRNVTMLHCVENR